MKISNEEVEHIAKLSRIRLTEQETQQMHRHLESVLGYFEALDGVDISKVNATAHILDSANVLRDDTVAPSMDTQLLLSNAPDSDDGAYIVPRVLE